MVAAVIQKAGEKMIGEHTEKYLNDAIESEYNNCIKNHGNFKNHHEAWAVLREEVQEVVECFPAFDVVSNGEMNALWNLIRHDHMYINPEDHIKKIRDGAEKLAKENIQVMAVCDKWMDLIRKEEKKR